MTGKSDGSGWWDSHENRSDEPGGFPKEWRGVMHTVGTNDLTCESIDDITDGTSHTFDPQQDGAVVGRHVVRLARNSIKEDIKNDLSTPRRFLLPEKCRNGSLVFTVPQGGTDTADFDLGMP